MAGYTRQSTADIIPTATVRAAPLNAEYNAIRDAFAASGGHKHDGTTAEGDYVPLISDLDNYNKVVIDSTNNRVGVFVEVSAAAVEQVRFQDGAIVPVTTNDIDLGTSSLKFKDLYIEGTATIGSISLDGGTIDDTVIGGTTPAAANFTTMDASGNATVGGTFAVTGNTTIGGTLGVTGVTTLGTANITSVDLDSGAIDNTTIGAATAAAGTFTTLTANTSLTAATADINGGTLDGVIIGGTTSAAATVTDLTATGTSTLTTVDINGGAIDGTTIGASSAAAGSFTTVSTSGQATLATADINGGTIDGTTIGATTPAAITGTTVTATSFVGPVTGNVTGNLTGNVTGDLTGDVTGNITSTGSSSFNNVTIDGTLNMNAGTTATITNLTSPTNTNDAATKGYVDTSIANLVDSAPGTLDTLNELAAALGDDPDFATTITASIATKLPLAGGTMTGAIAMGTSKITGLGDPTAAQDAATKNYVDTNALLLSGGTMTGDINMGGSTQLTNLPSPTLGGQAANKSYVDSILGSATAASASAAAAATSESNAATSETNAATSASNAATSETNTATLYDNFDDRYLGAKATAPTVDNDGDALITGALYFNTTTNIMNVYGSSGWQSAGSAVNGTSDRVTYTATSGQTVFAATYDAGYVDVYLNGVKLLAGTDFTATNGTSITLASGAAVNDIVDIVAYGTFVLADHYSKSQSDARYVAVTGDSMTGNLSFGDNDKAIFGAGSDLEIYHNSTAGENIIDANSGTLVLRSPGAGTIEFRDQSSQVLAQFNDNSDVKLYYNNNEKLATTSTGVDITGTLTSDGLTVDGTALMSTTNELQFYTSAYGIRASTGLEIKTGDFTRFLNGATELMRIDSSGNVGIGVSSPTAGLHIDNPNNGAITAILDTDNTAVKLVFRNNTETGNNVQIGADGSSLVALTNALERMRIDSSGNLLVGKTSSSASTTGAELQAGSGGQSALIATAAGTKVGVINRTTSDGDLLEFRKDGTAVGSIGVTGGDLMIGQGSVGIRFLDSAPALYPTIVTTGATASDSIDIGTSAARFKDLYLSGGVYLGGTGAANKLDDYEEGSWTPTVTGSTGGSATLTDASGAYTKIGRMVTVTAEVDVNSMNTATGTVRIGGLPFTVANLLSPTGIEAVGVVSFWNSFSTGVNSLGVGAVDGSTYMELYGLTSSTTTGISNISVSAMGSGEVRVTCTYFTT